MEGSRGDLVLGKNRGFIVPTKGQYGLRGKGAGGGVVRTCGNSLPLISVFLIISMCVQSSLTENGQRPQRKPWGFG